MSYTTAFKLKYTKEETKQNETNQTWNYYTTVKKTNKMVLNWGKFLLASTGGNLYSNNSDKYK